MPCLLSSCWAVGVDCSYPVEMRPLLWEILISKLAAVSIYRYNTIPPPVCVVEVICVANNTEGVVEVVLNNTPSSPIRKCTLQFFGSCVCPAEQFGEGVKG